jgi:large subunit ribosomal protein L4
VQLALRSALSDRANEGRVAVVETWDFDAPKTRLAREALGGLGWEGKVLVVVGPDEEAAIKSFRNLPEVQLLLVNELNAYDVLCNDWVVFTSATLPGSSEAAPAADAGDAATDDARDAPVQETDQLRAGTEGQP